MFTSSIMHVETNPFYPKNFLTIGDNTAKVNFYFWTINYNILFFCWKIIFSLKFNEVNSIKVSKNLSLFMIYKPLCFIYQYISLVQGGLSPHSPPWIHLWLFHMEMIQNNYPVNFLQHISVSYLALWSIL